MLASSRCTASRVVKLSLKRSISISPAVAKINNANNSNNNNTINHKFKFSYENAKNKPISQSEFNLPENKLDFNSYSTVNNDASLITNENAKLIPSIIALHARLDLPKEYPYSTLVTSLTCPSPDAPSLSTNNQQLSILGSHILSFYVSEYLMANYPRLPISILKSAIDAYIGNFSLYDVAKNSWGIEEDTTSKLDKYLSNEPEIFKFGTLRYVRKVTTPESNVVKYSKSSSPYELSKAEAYANSVRSIIAGLYIHTNNNDSIIKNFVHSHILSRQIDIPSLFQFKESGKLLSRLLKTNNMQAPTVRLISETGRLSSTPVYVVGCFSGENLLATAEGCSLREARIKSFNKALKAWYLYKPLDAKLPSDPDFNGMFVDQGEKFY